MSELDGFRLPPTAKHDENGDHIPPHIPEWRRAAGTDRTVRGSEVERDQRNKAMFRDHLAEHRRRGESAVVIEESS